MGFTRLRALLKDKINQETDPQTPKPVVLIIDDDPHLLEDLVFALQDNYDIRGFETGAAGLAALNEGVSAVVLDIKMPGEDGFQVFRQIKKRYTHLPVIFHSAYQDLKDPYEIMNEYRPFGYVSKSADLTQLRDSIHSAVNYYTQIMRNHALLDELQLTKNYLDNIINAMPSALVGIDAEKRVLHWNRKAEMMTGIKASRAFGKSIETVFPQILTQVSIIDDAISKRQPRKIEKLMQQENGKARYTDLLCYPLLNNSGEVEGAVLRLDDVTERVKLEEVMVNAEKMMTISGLAAGIAHEINNPLSVILQSVQMARYRLSAKDTANHKAARQHGLDMTSVEDFLTEQKIFKYIENIEESSQRTSEIVRNMLNFSRKHESKRTIEDIHCLIEDVIHLASNEYSLKKQYHFADIAIHRQFASDLPGVPCVKAEIGQVLLNLLRNAAQAMAAGRSDFSPQISIRTEKQESGILIAISDNGPGMDAETMEHVFEPFFTTKEEGMGTGLGLSVSHHIITEHHYGTLSVISEIGKGSTFMVFLPVEA